MTTNNDLLMLAKAMGKRATIFKDLGADSNLVELVILHDEFDQACIFNPRKNNDQFVKVLELIIKQGTLEISGNGSDVLLHIYDSHDALSNTFNTTETSFEENIINIAVQLTNWLSEDK